ncbi:hypothetical protein M9Y10_031487 [Tritrichomonas musculus]|uniref:PARP catalytic domain-containing protein n=1 Tax=Tritrichomonas musculus TaxID=1915356 RepID=A0ABR2GNG5_9EUKA
MSSSGRKENPSRRLMVHQTDPNAAASILQSKQMRSGSGGALGAGIYFCKTMDGTDSRALHHGTYIMAEVYLGKTQKDLNLDNRPDNVGSTVSGDRLPMYVVNQSDRVLNIRYLYGTLPPGVDVNNVELRDRMPLIYAAPPQDAANIIRYQKIPEEDRREIAGKGHYLWLNVNDAKQNAPKAGSTTFIAADVYFVDCFDNQNRMPGYHESKNYKSFRGNYKGTRYFMVKSNRNIARIHYIGGDRPPPPQ